MNAGLRGAAVRGRVEKLPLVRVCSIDFDTQK
jgi:hypothetical protein